MTITQTITETLTLAGVPEPLHAEAPTSAERAWNVRVLIKQREMHLAAQ